MNYTIENEFLRARIDERGAELVSLVSKNDDCEYIWQGDEKYWTGHSPIMFPICGRLIDGKYTYKGKEYELGCHGFARHSDFALYSVKGDEITLCLKSSKETKEIYPFDFALYVTFSLKGNALTTSYKVVNTGETELIFTLGAHPAFNVPLSKGEKFEDYYIEFAHECDAITLSMNDKCFLDGKDALYSGNDIKRIDLRHSLFDIDAVFLYNTAKKVSLLSEKSKKSVTLTFNNFKYLGLWHKPQSDAPYVCIEPWCGSPDLAGGVGDIENKPDMMRLPCGYSYSNKYKIEVK